MTIVKENMFKLKQWTWTASALSALEFEYYPNMWLRACGAQTQ
jgi:hypothetical protein